MVSVSVWFDTHGTFHAVVSDQLACLFLLLFFCHNLSYIYESLIDIVATLKLCIGLKCSHLEHCLKTVSVFQHVEPCGAVRSTMIFLLYGPLYGAI